MKLLWDSGASKISSALESSIPAVAHPAVSPLTRVSLDERACCTRMIVTNK